ncbi:DUF2530 domain-containing protein [Actinotalea sp. M2MS4P-6]|uniref:DUF2530 domain-containing protein n=1 Tax=Actinotalea sp. M2MS4P-6 TaxID=2983762 RepID=UPI0021E3D9AA|nr:DUF2530 domain-containing protein [Actinotalea sp. M2MS4P-6]MCV2395088.1 DUF2530 domain-containing protein [Actinotalea sp. M2MS4P-6]
MRILEPSRVAPLQVDLRRVFWGGIAIWVVALVVIGVLALAGVSTGHGVWVCLTGIALGGFGLLWERRHRSAAG